MTGRRSAPVKLALAAALPLAAAICWILPGHRGGQAGLAPARAARATAPHLIASLAAGGPAGQVAVSRDGRSLAAVTAGGVRVWNIATRRVTAELRERHVSSLAWSPDGQELAVAGQGVALWHIATRRPRAIVRTGEDGPVAFSPDGRFLAAVTYVPSPAETPSRVQLFRLSTRTLARTLPTDDDKFSALAFSPDGRLLAAGGQVSMLHGLSPDDGASTDVWQMATGRRVARFLSPQRHDPSGLAANSTDNTVAFSPDGTILATGRMLPAMSSVFTGIRLWNVATRQRIKQLTRAGGGSLAFSPDGRTLAAVSAHGTSVKLWNLASSTASTISLPANPAGAPPFAHSSTLAYSPDGSILAIPMNDTIQFWAVGRR